MPCTPNAEPSLHFLAQWLRSKPVLMLPVTKQLDNTTGMGVVYLEHEIGYLKVNGTRCAASRLQAGDLEIHQICEWKTTIRHGV